MSFAKPHLRYSTCFNAGFSGSPNGRPSHATVGGSKIVHKAGVTVLPYLAANIPNVTLAERIVLPLPPAYNCTSLFGALLGGGFGQVISEVVISSLEPLITAGTINILLVLQAAEIATLVTDLAEAGITLL
jgi:hypothetical protein